MTPWRNAAVAFLRLGFALSSVLQKHALMVLEGKGSCSGIVQSWLCRAGVLVQPLRDCAQLAVQGWCACAAAQGTCTARCAGLVCLCSCSGNVHSWLCRAGVHAWATAHTCTMQASLILYRTRSSCRQAS